VAARSGDFIHKFEKMDLKQEIKKSLLAAIWFMFLAFPILVVRVNTIERTVAWHWVRWIWLGPAIFCLSFVWRRLLHRRQIGPRPAETIEERPASRLRQRFENPRLRRPALAAAALFFLAIPLLFSWNKTVLVTNALIYVVIALGLNIVVGLAGQLVLGYVAFFAVGAYSYALLNHHFAIGFWTALPAGAALAAGFGLLLGIPVLRLRGDYLAIVTLGFGEIIRIVLENWNELSFGPSGIDNIPPPGFFGLSLTLRQSHIAIYYLMVLLTLLTILVVHRLQHSRIGRAWEALREDETAAQAMGIDTTRAKLSAFALGACWAGLGGVVFAAKQKFINPGNFTIWESILVLCIVVLGGMGSITGVVLAALVLVILPEALRLFADYRWLLFGALLVLMMVFRPGGLIDARRRAYAFEPSVPERAEDP
jgi:branched-chain amino acid transport system permease protein